jgi:hypothetical protein
MSNAAVCMQVDAKIGEVIQLSSNCGLSCHLNRPNVACQIML